jgi:hypothetical protein
MRSLRRLFQSMLIDFLRERSYHPIEPSRNLLNYTVLTKYLIYLRTTDMGKISGLEYLPCWFEKLPNNAKRDGMNG